MGVWNWLWEALTREPSRTSPAPRSRPGGSTEGSAVATADRTHHNPAQSGGDQEDARWWAPEGALLTEPVTPERPELAPEARALENLLISHFDGHDLKLPPLLHVAEGILSGLRDPKCNMPAIANQIAADQVVTAAVLRMANSPLYRGMHKITGLQPAVVRLGVKAIRTLMMHESLRAAMFHGAGVSSEYARMLWERSLAGACTMRGLSRFSSLNEEDAHLIGLLHDIGGVIVLRVAHDDHVFTRYDIDIDSFEYFCYECHQEFGELVADAWRLPDTLKTLITSHHKYPAENDPLRRERLLIMLTDMINSMLGYGPPASYDLLNTNVVKDLGLAERRDFVKYLEELPAQLDETVSAF